MDCAALETVAPELALGIADGAERAAALAHLAQCPRCRKLVQDLGRVADDLLLLAPEVAPPLGFEGRVRDHIIESTQAKAPRLTGRPKRLWIAAAVIAVLAAGGGLTAGRTTGGNSRTAVVTKVVQSGDGWCRVVAFRGHPTELVVQLDEHAESSGDYTVQADRTMGAPVALGAIHMQNGRGVLAVTVPAGQGKVSGVRVLDSTGAQRYRATFTPV